MADKTNDKFDKFIEALSTAFTPLLPVVSKLGEAYGEALIIQARSTGDIARLQVDVAKANAETAVCEAKSAKAIAEALTQAKLDTARAVANVEKLSAQLKEYLAEQELFMAKTPGSKAKQAA